MPWTEPRLQPPAGRARGRKSQATGPVERENEMGDGDDFVFRSPRDYPMDLYRTDQAIFNYNPPTSPIERTTQWTAVTKKRKHVELSDVEDEDERYPPDVEAEEEASSLMLLLESYAYTRISQDIDIIARRRQKTGAKAPKRGALALASAKMRGRRPQTPRRNTAISPRRSPRRPAPRFTPVRLNARSPATGSALRRSPRFTPWSQSPFTPIRAAIKRRHRNRGGREAGVKPFQLSFYTPHMKRVLQAGKDHYRFQVLTVNAYPDDAGRALMGRAAFDHGRARLEQDFDLCMQSFIRLLFPQY